MSELDERQDDIPQEQGGASSVLAALQGLNGGGNLGQELEALKPEVPAEEPKVEKPVVDPNNPEKVAADLLKQKTEKEAAEAKAGEEEGEEEEEDVEAKANAEAEEKKKKEEAKPVVIESPIFDGGKTTEKPKEEKKVVEFEGSEVVNEYIKKETGFDNLQSLVDSSLKSKEKLESIDKIQADVKKYESVFANMPQELYQSVDAYLKGQDWKAAILSRPNLDFTKDVDVQDVKTLTNNYFPGEITEAEWEDYNSDDPDPGTKKAIDIAIRQSKAKYDSDKDNLQNYTKNEVAKAEEFNKKIISSVEESLTHLQSNIDGLDAGYIQQTKNNLTVEGLTNVFFNPDGTFKKEAALKLTMAEHGYDLLNQYKNIAKHQAETEERTTILERTSDKPKAKPKADTKVDGVRPEIQQQLDDLISGTKKNTVY